MRSKWPPQEARRRLCELQALELRAQGKTYDAIARAVEWTDGKGEVHKAFCDRSHAHKVVEGAMTAAPSETIEMLRHLESTRLDGLFERAMEILGREDQDDDVALRAVDRLVRIIEQQSRLHGLNAAQKYEHTGEDGGPIETQIVVRIQERISHLQSLRTGELNP